MSTFVRRYFLIFAVLGAIGYAFCPKPELYQGISFSSAVYDRNGDLMRLQLANDDRYRLFAHIDQLPSNAVQATLLYEDQYFEWHPGVNPFALVRAAWSTYVVRSRVIGASTITMQLARLRFSINTRSISGKLTQMLRATQLERHYSKEQIIEAYLNLAPYGGNIEGLAAASIVYFGKPPEQLSFPEALALAVVPQNPSKRMPSTQSGYRNMIAARTRLISMWQDKYGIEEQANALLNLPLQVASPSQLPFHAPHFLAQLASKQHENDGSIQSTIDLTLQRKLESHILRYVDQRKHEGINNASALLLDYESMEIIASVGSADFYSHAIAGQVNGTTAKRSPGSTLKPFVYGLAMDQGVIHPMSLLKDAPKRFGIYTPENFDRGFMGPIVAKDALVYSRNVPAINLLARVGHQTFHKFLVNAHVADLNTADHYGLAMILGGNELNMQELVALYAMLANDGKWQSLKAIQPNTYRSQETINPPSTPTLISAEASFLVLDMLRDNPRPDQLSVNSSITNSPIAWKTGTSYAFRDAWTVGVFGQYVLAVWVGNFDGTSNPTFVGRQAAAPLFFNIADALNNTIDTPDYARTAPSHLNVRQVDICANTGDLPNRYCPSVAKSWFIPGISPIKVSNVYRPIQINPLNGKRTCLSEQTGSREEVYEFWPSDITRLFQQAGISLKRPPPWEDHCVPDHQAAAGIPPKITSPNDSVVYQVRARSQHTQSLPLTATTDADASTLFWFVNNHFIAQVDRDEPLLWQAIPGQFDILVVDDLGRSASNNIAVMQID